MNAQEFVYWLQGFLEIARPEIISAEQVQEIKNHIQLVLKKVTPTIDNRPLQINLNNPPAYEVSWLHNASC